MQEMAMKAQAQVDQMALEVQRERERFAEYAVS